MSSPFMILLVGLLYIVLFGGLSLLRREGLSIRFAVESVLITLALAGLALLIPGSVDVILTLIILYLGTMRVRLLVDLGVFFAKRRNTKMAASLFRLAGNFWPDSAGKMIIAINHGVMEIALKNYDSAIQILREVLNAGEHEHFGIKHEVAAHYNLGVAYLRKEMPNQANNEFREVLDIWPASEFARRAEAALQKSRNQPQL